MKVKKVLPLVLWFLFLFFGLREIHAQATIESDNYEILWPNVNVGSALPSSSIYKLGKTTGHKIRAGFQYIHSTIPFSFEISSLDLSYGPLSFTVNPGSAGGYQLTAQAKSGSVLDYTLTGEDIPPKFKSSQNINTGSSLENPVRIMSKTSLEGSSVGRNKTATMSARINVSNSQPVGTYLNVLTFIATPTF